MKSVCGGQSAREGKYQLERGKKQTATIGNSHGGSAEGQARVNKSRVQGGRNMS